MKVCRLIIYIFIVFDILGMTEYNNDWDVYQYRYENLYVGGDFLFDMLNAFFSRNGVDYIEFFRLCQFVTFFLLFYTYNKICNSYVGVFSFLLLSLIAPHLNILMQYYLGFAVLLLSLFFYVRRKKKEALFFAVTAFGIHTGLVVFIPIYFIYKLISLGYYNDGRFLRRVVLLSFVLFFAYNILFFVAEQLGLSVFLYYKDWDKASISSTLFMCVVYFSWFIWIQNIHANLRNLYGDKIMRHDNTYAMLLSLNILPFLFIFLSNVMIMQFRVYEPLLIASFIYIAYVNKVYCKNKILVMKSLWLILLCAVLKYVVLGYLTGGESEWFKHYFEIIMFNSESKILNIFR